MFGYNDEDILFKNAFMLVHFSQLDEDMGVILMMIINDSKKIRKIKLDSICSCISKSTLVQVIEVDT